MSIRSNKQTAPPFFIRVIDASLSHGEREKREGGSSHHHPLVAALKARPEADFPMQGRIFATTPVTREVRPRRAWVTVGQVRQVDVAPQREGDVARQADVKVG